MTLKVTSVSETFQNPIPVPQKTQHVLAITCMCTGTVHTEVDNCTSTGMRDAAYNFLIVN